MSASAGRHSSTQLQAARLALGVAVEGELQGGALRDYELVLESGQFVDVAVEQLGINVRATLLNPDSSIIVEADSHRGARGIERVCAIAEAGGRYKLRIQSMRELAVPGKYRVTVTAWRPATIQDRERLVAQELFAEGDRLRVKLDKVSLERARELYQKALAHWEAIGDVPRQAVTLRQISAIAGRLGLVRQVLDEGGRAVKLYRALGDKSGEAHSIFTMGDALRGVWHELDLAREHYEQALSICHEIGERLIEGLLLHRLALLARERGEKQQALDNALQSLALLEAAGEPGNAADAFAELRAACESLDDKSKAIAAYKQARQVSRERGDRKMEAMALIEIARLHRKLRELPDAVEADKEALALFRAVGDRAGETRVLAAIGELSAAPHQKQSVIDELTQAVVIYDGLNDISKQVAALKSLSLIYVSIGQMQKAVEQSYRAWQLCHAAGNLAEEAAALQTMAEVYREAGDRPQAVELAERAAQLFRSIGDREGEIKTLLLAGNIHHLLGDYQRALDRLNQAVALSRKLGKPNLEAVAMSQFASVYPAMGDREKGLQAHLRCLALARAVGDRQLEAYTLHNLGWSYQWKGDKQKALDYHERALKLFRQLGDRIGEANALRGVGRAYGELGQVQKGIDLNRQAVTLARASGDPAWEAMAFYSLAILYRFAGQLSEARESVETALRLRESVRDEVLDRDLRSAYLSTTHQYYEFYIDLLMRLHEQDSGKGYDAEALSASEGSRARSLLALLAEARADIHQAAPPELVERERALLQQLSDKTEQLLALKNGRQKADQAAAIKNQQKALLLDLRQVQDQIRAANPRRAEPAEPPPLSLAEIRQQVLDPDTVLLEYALGHERSHLWAVTPTSIQSFALPKRAEIEAQAKKVYGIMTARSALKKGATKAQWQARWLAADKQFPAEVAKLSRLLLGPVAAHLSNKRLLIVADGALQYIPFAVLPEPMNTGKITGNPLPIADYQPLIVNHEIVNLPSASTLAVLRRETAGRPVAPKLAAVLADPVFSKDDERFGTPSPRGSSPDQSIARRELRRAAEEAGVADEEGEFRRLKASRAEAEAIAALVPKEQLRQSLDFNASRATAMDAELGQYRIVHFATHGIVSSRNPALSSLVLSLVNEKGAEQNGFLRMHEIYNLKLPADLVVLSACQTALGRDVRGEGLIGLTRGFMYAGTSRVLASLWAVRDEETANLMMAFYTHLLGKDGQMRMTPAAALRQAQIERWRTKRRSEPFYWAGFVLQGEYK